MSINSEVISESQTTIQQDKYQRILSRILGVFDARIEWCEYYESEKIILADQLNPYDKTGHADDDSYPTEQEFEAKLEKMTEGQYSISLPDLEHIWGPYDAKPRTIRGQLRWDDELFGCLCEWALDEHLITSSEEYFIKSTRTQQRERAAQIIRRIEAQAKLEERQDLLNRSRGALLSWEEK